MVAPIKATNKLFHSLFTVQRLKVRMKFTAEPAGKNTFKIDLLPSERQFT